MLVGQHLVGILHLLEHGMRLLYPVLVLVCRTQQQGQQDIAAACDAGELLVALLGLAVLRSCTLGSTRRQHWYCRVLLLLPLLVTWMPYQRLLAVRLFNGVVICIAFYPQHLV